MYTISFILVWLTGLGLCLQLDFSKHTETDINALYLVILIGTGIFGVGYLSYLRAIKGRFA